MSKKHIPSRSVYSALAYEYKGREIVVTTDFVTIDGHQSNRTYLNMQAEVEFIEQLIDAEEAHKDKK